MPPPSRSSSDSASRSSQHSITATSARFDRATYTRSTFFRVERRLGGPGPDGADEAERVAGLRERGDLDHVAGVRRVDELPAADVDPLVLRAAGGRLGEVEVAGQQPARRDPHALVELRAGVVGEPDPELRVDVHRQAGAVEAADRVGAAPAVGDAEVLLGDPDGPFAGRRAARSAEQELLREGMVAVADVFPVAGDAEREPGEARVEVWAR